MMFTVFVENVAENFRVVDGLRYFESVAFGSRRSASDEKDMHGLGDTYGSIFGNRM